MSDLFAPNPVTFSSRQPPWITKTLGFTVVFNAGILSAQQEAETCEQIMPVDVKATHHCLSGRFDAALEPLRHASLTASSRMLAHPMSV